MSRIRVLISDNCNDFASLLSKRLALNSEIEIVGIAQDGVQTIRLLQQNKLDVLLLDIVMPKVDGLGVLRQMNIEEDKPLVFIMSAVGNDEIIKQALTLGAKEYFIKPLNVASVISKIRAAKL